MTAQRGEVPSKPDRRRLLSVCLLVVFHSGPVGAVNITSPSSLLRGVQGGEALLSVSYSSLSADAPVIKWLLLQQGRDGPPVTVVQSIGSDIIGTPRPEYRDRILVFPNGTLLLHNLRLSDEGTYGVEISITDDTFTGEGSIDLTVDQPISRPYVHTESYAVLERSENVVLNCSHENGTRTSYSWVKGGKALAGNESRLFLSSDRRYVTITRVLMSDDDVYSCAVENPLGGMKSLPMRLSVYRRSSLYIILSTGGIFLLITLVTVCACWKPSKKKKHPGTSRNPLLKSYDHCQHSLSVPIVIKPERKNPVSLYILETKGSFGCLKGHGGGHNGGGHNGGGHSSPCNGSPSESNGTPSDTSSITPSLSSQSPADPPAYDVRRYPPTPASSPPSGRRRAPPVAVQGPPGQGPPLSPHCDSHHGNTNGFHQQAPPGGGGAE